MRVSSFDFGKKIAVTNFDSSAGFTNIAFSTRRSIA
jgi:hypothetical protein